MGVIRTIYSMLAEDEQLNADLARSVFDNTGTKPAIYELWPGENAKMPYVITAWDFPEGSHWAKVNGVMSASIFVDNRDTERAERIKKRINELLAWKQVTSEQDGRIRIYKGPNDLPGGAESPDVIHWLTDFDVIYWRQEIVNN